MSDPKIKVIRDLEQDMRQKIAEAKL